MPTFDYDLFVIGGGSGGVRSARLAASMGKKVAIAEEFRFGGTCVIRGCVPKKLYVYASQFPEHFEDAAGFGWQVRIWLEAWVETNADYVDPGIGVDVHHDGIRVSWGGEEHAIAFDAVEASLTIQWSDGSAYFKGMKLESPIGLIELDDETFDRGCSAAAAIVQGMHWAREERDRLRRERLF